MKFQVGSRVIVPAEEDFVPGSDVENGYDGPWGRVTGTVIEMVLDRGALNCVAIVHVDEKFAVPYMCDRNLEIAVASDGSSPFMRPLR